MAVVNSSHGHGREKRKSRQAANLTLFKATCTTVGQTHNMPEESSRGYGCVRSSFHRGSAPLSIPTPVPQIFGHPSVSEIYLLSPVALN